jgi:hypothetical protein
LWLLVVVVVVVVITAVVVVLAVIELILEFQYLLDLMQSLLVRAVRALQVAEGVLTE